MTAADDPKPTLACPDLMGAMIVALNIDLNRLNSAWNRVLVQHAITRCSACASRRDCRRWLGGVNEDPTGYRSFCPNAGLFDRFTG